MSTFFQKVPVLYNPIHKKHHPRYEYDRGEQIAYQEVPRRIESALEALSTLPFVDIFQNDKLVPIDFLCEQHDSAMIAHIQKISREAARTPGEKDTYLYPWIYPLNARMREKLLDSPDAAGCFAFDLYAPIGQHTWEAVWQSASLAVQSAEMILEGQTRLAYALCRPPGHHAGVRMMGGYCYLNNAALAAQKLLTLGRGAILDIDYHHGNGTQEIFWDRSEVMFVSLHADPSDEYPFFSGFDDELGGPQAVGTNQNFPLPKGCDDRLYLNTLAKAIEKINQYQPHWLVLSAGFDTISEDPSTFFELTPAAFPKIGEMIRALDIPVVVVHEGGYAVEQNGILSAALLNSLYT